MRRHQPALRPYVPAQPLSIGTPADAKEVLEASQKDLAVADRWRGIALLAQLVFRDALEVWARFDDVHFAVVIYEEDQPAHQDWGGVMPPELFLPEHLAGGGFVAERHAGVVDAEQKITRYDQ